MAGRAHTFFSKCIHSNYVVGKPAFECALKTIDARVVLWLLWVIIAKYKMAIFIPISIIIFANRQEDELADSATLIARGDTAGSGIMA